MKNRHRDFSTSSKSRQLRSFLFRSCFTPQQKKKLHTNHKSSYRSRFSTLYVKHRRYYVSHTWDQQLTGKKVGKQPIRELKTINRAFQLLHGAKNLLPF